MKKRSKFGNVKTVVDGITFDSKREAKRYGELKLLKAADKIIHLTLQPVYTWTVRYIAEDGTTFDKKQSYRADFQYWELIDGEQVFRVEDVKGVRTKEYKAKKRIMKKLFGIEIFET